MDSPTLLIARAKREYAKWSAGLKTSPAPDTAIDIVEGEGPSSKTLAHAAHGASMKPLPQGSPACAPLEETTAPACGKAASEGELEVVPEMRRGAKTPFLFYTLFAWALYISGVVLLALGLVRPPACHRSCLPACPLVLVPGLRPLLSFKGAPFLPPAPNDRRPCLAPVALPAAPVCGELGCSPGDGEGKGALSACSIACMRLNTDGLLPHPHPAALLKSAGRHYTADSGYHCSTWRGSPASWT